MRNNNKHTNYMAITMGKRIAQYIIHSQSTLNNEWKRPLEEQYAIMSQGRFPQGANNGC